MITCNEANTHPGVANLEDSDATAISQLATSWQPAAVARPETIKNKLIWKMYKQLFA